MSNSKNERLEKLKKSPKLPSPPQVAMKILELDRQPDSGITEITAVVESDPAIAAQILKFSNSPLSGLSRKIANLRQAITLIGTRVTKLIALSFSLLKTGADNGKEFNIEKFWQGSVAIGVAAKCLTASRGGSPGSPDTAFITGLLSKLGWLLVQNADSESYQQIMDSGSNDFEIQEKSRGLFDKSLYEIAAETLESWSFPQEIYSVVKSSEYPESAPGVNAQIQFLSRKIAEILTGAEVSVSVDECRALYSKLGPADAFDEIFEQITEAYIGYLNLMEIKVPEVRELWEVEQEAKRMLAEVTMEIQLENQDLQNKNQLLLDDVETDRLTGLRNRRSFELRASEEVERANRNRRTLGLLVVDIDHFKSFNDVYGHLIGDMVLKEVGRCMDRSIRKYDTTFRYGGEEFVILLPDSHFEDVTNVAERVRNAVEKLRIEVDSKVLAVTISMGVAFTSGNDVTTWKKLFEEADKQLYRAKKEGRNRVCYPNGHKTSMGAAIVAPPTLIHNSQPSTSI